MCPKGPQHVSKLFPKRFPHSLGSLVQMEGESWTGQVMKVRDDEAENGAPLGVVILTGNDRAAKMLWCNEKVLKVVQKR